MQIEEMPRFQDSKVVFPQVGAIELDGCVLADLEEVFGNGFIDLGLPGKNQAAFNYFGGGKLIAFFQPEQPIAADSRMLALDFVLTAEDVLDSESVSFNEFAAFYQRDPQKIKVIPFCVDGNPKFCAVLGLNLQLTCSLNERQVETVHFVTTDYITRCPCPFCSLKRAIVRSYSH